MRNKFAICICLGRWSTVYQECTSELHSIMDRESSSLWKAMWKKDSYSFIWVTDRINSWSVADHFVRGVRSQHKPHFADISPIMIFFFGGGGGEGGNSE